MDKEQLKQQILQLNNPDYPYEFAVNGDSIIGYWNWVNAKWFIPGSVTAEQREYNFIVNLIGNKTYTEYEKHSDEYQPDDNSFQAVLAKFGVKNDDDSSLTSRAFAGQSTDDIKGPLRDFLKQNGWKKASALQTLINKVTKKDQLS